MDSFGYNLTSNNKAIIKKFLGPSTRAIIIPSKLFGIDVIAIDDSAFYNETKFTGVVELQQGIKTIGSYAFAKCKNLIKIILPMSVEEIKDGAFSDCPLLEEVRFLGNMPKIGKELFKNSVIVKVMYYVTARGWERPTFADRETEAIDEDGDHQEDDISDDVFQRNDDFFQTDDRQQRGDYYDEGEEVPDEEKEEDLFQYEEPRYMDEINAFERAGVGSMANTSLKNVSNPIEAFRLRLSGVFNKVKRQSMLTEGDLAVMLEPIAIIENIKFKNPAGYLVGYIASEKGTRITEKGFKAAFDLLDIINDVKTMILSPPDIIRYAVFWIYVKTTYIN